MNSRAIIVAASRNGESCGTSAPNVCSTKYYRGSGSSVVQRNAAAAPCDGEMSAYVHQGLLALDGVYVDAPFELLSTDIPNNDLGVVQQIRDAALAGLTSSYDAVETQAIAAINTFNIAPAFFKHVHAVKIDVSVDISSANAPQAVDVSTRRFFDGENEETADRAFILKLQEAVATFSIIFFPAAKDPVSLNYSPTPAIVWGGLGTAVQIQGLTGPGTVTVRVIGGASQSNEELFAAIQNAESA